jgi:hypothetical protein
MTDHEELRRDLAELLNDSGWINAAVETWTDEQIAQARDYAQSLYALIRAMPDFMKLEEKKFWLYHM